MQPLTFLFNTLSHGGIIGPHAGYEADLMLAGVKPIAMLPFFTDDGMRMDPAVKKMWDDCAHLTEAATEGRLSTTELRIDERSTLRFSCQPGLESDMFKLAKAHELFWAGKDEDALEVLGEKSIGAYLGYTKEDCDLFEKNGLPILLRLPVISLLYRRYNEQKRDESAKALLFRAAHAKEKPQPT
jgi:hypothetical protein